MGPEVKTNWLWESWTCSRCPKIMEIMTCWIVGKWQLKIISPPYSRIIQRSFLAFQSSKFGVRMPPQTLTDPEHKNALQQLTCSPLTAKAETTMQNNCTRTVRASQRSLVAWTLIQPIIHEPNRKFQELADRDIN